MVNARTRKSLAFSHMCSSTLFGRAGGRQGSSSTNGTGLPLEKRLFNNQAGQNSDHDPKQVKRGHHQRLVLRKNAAVNSA